MNKLRAFESFGIYVSIVFTFNLNREPAWRFLIDTTEETVYESIRFYNYDKCEKEALKKAVDYI